MNTFGYIIVIKKSGADGFRYPLNKTACYFGRDTECDIQLQLPVVPKQQCKIEFNLQLKEAILTNLNSTIPTRLNGSTFCRPIKLEHGDLITIIDRSFRFEYEYGFQNERKPRRTSETKNKEVIATPSRSTSVLSPDVDHVSFGNIPMKHTEENIVRPNTSKKHADADLDNVKDLLTGIMLTLETKELTEGATDITENTVSNHVAAEGSGGDLSLFSTPKHPGMNEDIFSPFSELFGLRKDDSDAQSQPTADLHDSRRKPGPSSRDDAECEAEFFHSPNSSTVRCVTVSNGSNDNSSDGEKEPKDPFCNNPLLQLDENFLDKEDQQSQQLSMPSKWRKSEEQPAENSGKYSEGRGKEDKRRRSAPRGPLGDAQSQSSLHTLRSQTKRPDMCFLGSGGHGLLPKLKRGGSPIEIRTGESVDLAENKGIPKGKKNSGGNQLRNPKKASNSEQMLKETEDEPCFKGLSEMKVSTTYISPRPSNSSTDSTKNSSTFLPKLTPQDDDETPNKSLDEDEVDERPHCVSPDISDFDISDFDSSSDSSTDKLDNVTENNESCAKRRRVSFGALLRPELFDENLPPNTPLKKGESPETRKTSSGTYVPRKSIMKTHSKPPEKEPSDSLVEGILHTKDPSQELPATFSLKKKSARGRDNNSLSKLLDERATSIPEIQTIQPHKIVSTPSLPRRSSSGRRSQFDTLQTIYAKRRSGASKANIMVVHSWADVVRLGTKKPQAHVVIKHGLERRIIKKQKRLTPKVKEKPANHAQNHFSTGHANSPCTIVIGRAHTEKVTVPIRPCRMLNNFVLNPKMDMNEDLTGLADMFETPIKQKTANASPEIGTTLHKSSSGDEDSLEQRSDNYFSAERLIPTISNTTEQLYGQSITCRRSPRNRQRRVDNDEIVKTLKEISEIRSDEITKTPLQEVDVDPKILTPSSKKVKTCTSKENVSTPYLGRIKTPPLDQKVISMEEKFESGNVNRATPKISRKFVEPSRTSMAEHHPVITSATATHITSNSRANTFNIKGATEVAYKVEKEKENAIDIDLRNQKPKLSGQLVTTSLKRKSNKEPPVTDQPTRIIKQSRSQNEEYSPTGANKISIKPGIVSLDFQAAPGTVTPNYINEPGGMKKVIRTPKGKRKTEDLIVIRVPMATPTSMVAELKEDEENKVAESAVDDANSVQENLGTAPKQGEVQKKLMRTVEQQTEAEDLPEQLMKTPKRKCGSVEHLTTVVKRLMGTPKDKVESEEEEVGGNERMMMSSSKEKSNQNMNVKQPLQQKGPSKDLVGLRDQLVHIQKKNVQLPEDHTCLKELRTTTPKQMLEPIKDRNINKSLLIKLDQKHGSVEDLTMTRRLIRTPKEKEEHLIEDVKVVKKSVETSKQKCNPEYSVSIKKFNEIPKIEPIENTAGGLGKLRRKPKGVEKLTGLRNMTVPKEKSKVVENLTGFRRLSKMSKVKPAEDQTGIKLVERTPKEKESGDDLTGMRQFMRSKKVREESLEDLTDIKMKMSRKAEVEDLIGIKKLMRTPKVKGESSEEPTGVKGLTRVSPKKVKGESPQELLGIKRSMSPKKIKAELMEDLTGTKRLRTHKKIKGESEDLTDVTVFMETPKKVVDISNPQKLQEIEILRRPAIKKFNDQENKITENILESPQEVQIQTVGGISKLLEPSREKEFKRDMFESKNLEAEPKSQEPDFEINNTGLENMDESPQESKDQSVDQCQKKICTNPYEEDENKSNISKIDGLYSVNLEDNIMMERDELLTEARSMTTEKEEDEINDFLLNNESQISISLRSKSKNKDTESLHEKSVKRSLSPSEKVEVEEPLKSGSRMFWDTVNNTENRVHLRPRKRNQAADKTKRSSSDLSDIENAEQKSVKNLTETFDNAVPDAGTGIMLRSSNKNKDPPSESDVSQTVDEKKLGKRLPRKANEKLTSLKIQGFNLANKLTIEKNEKRGFLMALRARPKTDTDEKSKVSGSVSEIISHTEENEKKPPKVLKELKLKKRIVNKEMMVLRSKNKKEIFPSESDKIFPNSEKEPSKNFPGMLKGQKLVLHPRNRNKTIEELNLGLSSEIDELHTENDQKYVKSCQGKMTVIEDGVASRTRSKTKIFKENKSNLREKICIESKEKTPPKSSTVHAKMESLRSSNIIKSAKESQKPNLGLPTELCKTENKEKKLKDASPNIGMMTSKTGGKNKVDAESQELNNTLSRETNRLHKSFPEKFMSLRSPGKNKTEAQESICMECLGKSIPEKKANKKEVSPCHGSSRSRSRGIRLLHAARVAPKIKLKEEKKPAKVQKTALRSSNKNKKDTGLKGSNPVSTPTNDIEKDEEKCMGICPNIFKNSLVPEGILCLTRNRNKQPQDINHIPSPTKIVEKQLPSLENKAEDRVEESFRIGSQSETEKELYSSPLLRAMEIACAENKDRGMTEDWVHLRSKGRNRSNTEWIGFNPLSKDILPLGKIGKENILQIFPDKCLNEKGSDTNLQRSANLSKDEPSSAASETTVLTAGESTPEKVSSWKKTFYSTILTKKRRKSKTPSGKLSEPTDVEKYSPESRLLKSVPKAKDSLKVVLLPQETQSEPSLLREGSSSTMLKNNTNQTQENDAVESTKLSNDQEFSNSWKRRKHNLRRPNQLPEVQNRQQRRK